MVLVRIADKNQINIFHYLLDMGNIFQQQFSGKTTIYNRYAYNSYKYNTLVLSIKLLVMY